MVLFLPWTGRDAGEAGRAELMSVDGVRGEVLLMNLNYPGLILGWRGRVDPTVTFRIFCGRQFLRRQ